LPAQYEWADILLHTSLHEAQGVVVAEAAAAGVVICGTKVGLLSDLSPHAAVTVATGDFSGLAAEVLNLLHDRQHQTTLRKSAHDWANSHNSKWTAQEYSAIYKQISIQDKR
jgi:glycosyltransferase involved in cell wall biosynthesis